MPGAFVVVIIDVITSSFHGRQIILLWSNVSWCFVESAREALCQMSINIDITIFFLDIQDFTLNIDSCLILKYYQSKVL